ncbi:MAG: elongation factor [Gaiellales bacterium]|jgi:elongation factor G|nr:elongation factor [Gaiellales bacterium]
MPFAPDKIRNVAVVGHRGTGKTSLTEALLYETGEINRLGSVAEGTTVSDHDEDERRRGLSISAALTHATWNGRKLNLIDTPGDPSFQADALGALRVVEGALFVVSGVLGVEVSTVRLWKRCEELGLARIAFVNLLDRERADFAATLSALQSQLSPNLVAISLPIGEEHGFRGVVDLLHMVAYEDAADGSHESDPVPIPDELREQAEEWRERLMDHVAEASDDLMERYLEGKPIADDELVLAFKDLVVRGELFPVACGAASRNVGTRALLDLIVDGLPSPARADRIHAHDRSGDDIVLELEGPGVAAYCFKTIADAHVGKLSLLRVFAGRIGPETPLVNERTHHKERVGQILSFQGREHTPVPDLGPGDIGAVPKLKDVLTGDVLADTDRDLAIDPVPLPTPVVSVAVEPRTKGDDEKMGQAFRRLSEEDPTLRLARDERTGELIVSGLSQMHVEVTVDRLKRRFGVEVLTHPPRVPYLEAIRRKARAQGRYKKQTGGRGQFGDCHIELEPLPGHEGYEFIDKIVGGVIPGTYRPAVDRGVQETMATGELAGYPVVGVRVTLVDGSYHAVDSSEMAFRIAGSMAFKKAYAEADPVLLEPVMAVEVTVPEANVGDVLGDLNSRRGRPLGMEPAGATTVIRAEVPMSEMLGYSPDLTSMTGGRGDYAMTLARYEEVPDHVAQKLRAAAAQPEKEVVRA